MRLLLFFTVFVCKGIFAQPINLVPNPSFEFFNNCPISEINNYYNGLDQICLAYPWFQPYYPNDISWSSGCGGSSSDFFHSCAGIIPDIAWREDFQLPNKGVAFAGFSLINLWSPNDYREYIEVPILSSLKRKRYCVSWYNNLGGDSYAINRIGAFFSKDTLFQVGFWNPIYLDPQVENLAIVTDTQNWVPFHQIFTAEGGERFMTIGNFRLGNLTDSTIINPQFTTNYYYFDDFGVYELPEISAGLGGEIDTLGENVPLSVPEIS